MPTATSTLASDLEQAIVTAINHPAVKIKVLPQQGGKPFVVVSGKLSQAAITHLKEVIFPQFTTSNIVAGFINNLEVATPPAKQPDTMTADWPLVFVDSHMPGREMPKQYEVQPMIDMLNKIYGTSGNDTPVRLGRNTLVLRGDEATLTELKRQLVQLDAAGPQVQLDTWAIQISGKRSPQFNKALQEIASDVRQTQEVLRLLPQLIQVKKEDIDLNDHVTKAAINHLRSLNFIIDPEQPDPERHLSLSEKMIFVGLTSKEGRLRIYQDLEKAFTNGANKPLKEQTPLYRLWERNKATMANETDWKNTIFPLSTGVFAGPDINAAVKQDRLAIRDFAAAAVNFLQAPPTLDEPDKLRTRAATADVLVKNVIDAFTADIQHMFLDPLLKRIWKKQESGNIKGISLVGRSRLVVTSGLDTNLKPDLVSYVETTRPAPLSLETINSAFPATRSGSDTAATTTNIDAHGNAVTTGTAGTSSTAGFTNLTGLAQFLPSMAPIQALAVMSALNPPTPTFTRVAPGIDINVRPAVMPDAGSARLQVDMTFGVETSQFEGNATAKNVLTYPLADAVKSHRVSTDAIVSALDLFDISSFSISTTHPRPPGYIPVLGTLPIIGRAFQWRRSPAQIDHHSLILVNTVILPRTMNLVQFYGGSVVPIPIATGSNPRPSP
jgi:hypothetical protein